MSPEKMLEKMAKANHLAIHGGLDFHPNERGLRGMQEAVRELRVAFNPLRSGKNIGENHDNLVAAILAITELEL